MSRLSIFDGLFDPAGVGLEIGPSHSPTLPKRDGFTVETVDHATADNLRSKYKDFVDCSGIEEVDYVWTGQPLHDLIPHRDHYDFVFSSHVIEHIPDFLGHLRSCAMLLKPEGKMIMAVPDKRYSFDAMRNVSTTGEILQAHHEQRGRHAPCAIFDGFADAAHLGPLGTWTSALRSPLVFRDGAFDYASRLFDDSLSSEDYIDAHGWCFTPTSFRLLIRDLCELGVLDLRLDYLRETNFSEFYVVLSRSAEPEAISRVILKRHLLKEQALSIVQLLGGTEDLRQTLFDSLTINEDIAPVLA